MEEINQSATIDAWGLMTFNIDVGVEGCCYIGVVRRSDFIFHLRSDNRVLWNGRGARPHCDASASQCKALGWGAVPVGT